MKKKIINLLKSYATDHGCVECGGRGESISSKDFSMLAEEMDKLVESNFSKPSYTEIVEAENQAYESAGDNAYFGNGFRDGAKWMLHYVNTTLQNKREAQEYQGTEDK